MKQLILVSILASIHMSVMADPPNSGTPNGNGCIENCGHQGGSGGNGGAGGSSGASATSTSGSTAISGAVSGSVSGAIGLGGSAQAEGGSAQGSANASIGSVSGGGNSSNQFSSRAYALSAGSIGSPSNDTCAAHVSVFFGAATFPVTLESCVALNEALFLIKLGENRAAIERLCQLASIGATSLCNKGQ